MRSRVIVFGLILLALFAYSLNSRTLPTCDADNGGLTLPEGFCALIVADNNGPARHLVVSPAGDIYLVASRFRLKDLPNGVMALRDTDGDGRADRRERWESLDGTGIELRGEYLYVSSNTAIGRYRLTAGELRPSGPLEMMIGGLPAESEHPSKPFTFDDQGHLFVTVGAPSNACQQVNRKPGAPGLDPCPELERRGGIWRFDADRPGQTQEKDGHRFSTGIRNAVAITFNSADKQVYVVQHGRDSLDTLWPDKGFSAKDNAERPAEEMFRLSDGADFGWPKCFFDLKSHRKVLSPEYGGDGVMAGGCDAVGQPTVAFPAHTAPEDVQFYHASQFPERYRGGAFVAFHGSWNRAPEPEEGYYVLFAPWKSDTPTGSYEVFADGFAGGAKGAGAIHRPVGLAVGPDGSLYVGDSRKGTIWRIIYEG